MLAEDEYLLMEESCLLTGENYVYELMKEDYLLQGKNSTWAEEDCLLKL
jgi:hypothetical protein